MAPSDERHLLVEAEALGQIKSPGVSWLADVGGAKWAPRSLASLRVQHRQRRSSPARHVRRVVNATRPPS